MNPTITRLARYFLIAFAGIVTVIAVTQVVWIIPGKKCEAQGMWWDWHDRVCARPIAISDITGRMISDDKSRAAAKAEVHAPQAPVAPKP